MGRLHAGALKSLAESEFVAVCDADLSRARIFAADYDVAAYTDVEQMVRDRKVEAVCICTPHPLHAAAAIQAMDGGAHVLVEKPMAASLQDCDAMLAAATRNGVQVGAVSQRRFFEPVLRMKSAIDAGKIGTPALGTVLMLSWRDEAYYASDPWRGKWETEGGGVLMNQAPHHLDLLRWFMGPIEEISGSWVNVNHPYIEVEDTVAATVRFWTGGLGSIVVSVSQRPGLYSKVHIHGSSGASIGVQTDGGATFVAGVSEIVEPAVTDFWTVPGEEHLLSEFQANDREKFGSVDRYHKLQIADFLQAVAEKRLPLVTGEDGRAVVEMIAAVYESNRLGKPIKFPVKYPAV